MLTTITYQIYKYYLNYFHNRVGEETTWRIVSQLSLSSFKNKQDWWYTLKTNWRSTKVKDLTKIELCISSWKEIKKNWRC